MPNSKDEKLIQKKLKRFFEPRKEFIEETRVLFLSKIERVENKDSSSLKFINLFTFKPVLRYSLVALFIIIFLSGGLVIYADSNNVGASSPFYRFKKTGEKVRLMMAPKDRRPMIDHQIAQRRIEEMHGFKDIDDHMIEVLSNEYKNEINLSLDKMDNLNKERLDQIRELCAKIAQTMASKVQIVKAADIDDYLLQHFKEHCGQFIMMPNQAPLGL